MFVAPCESQTCGAGLLPEQFKLPRRVLVTTSFPSGSAVALLVKFTLWAGVADESKPAGLPPVDHCVAADYIVFIGGIGRRAEQVRLRVAVKPTRGICAGLLTMR